MNRNFVWTINTLLHEWTQKEWRVSSFSEQVFFVLTRFCTNRESLCVLPSSSCPSAASFTWWGRFCSCPKRTSLTLCPTATPMGEGLFKQTFSMRSEDINSCFLLIRVNCGRANAYDVEQIDDRREVMMRVSLEGSETDTATQDSGTETQNVGEGMSCFKPFMV